jgi:Helix-turn-helix domain
MTLVESTGSTRRRAKTANSDDRLDVLFGAQAIADYLGIDRRTVYHSLERKLLPAGKMGKVWVTTRSRLRAFFEGDER